MRNVKSKDEEIWSKKKGKHDDRFKVQLPVSGFGKIVFFKIGINPAIQCAKEFG